MFHTTTPDRVDLFALRQSYKSSSCAENQLAPLCDSCELQPAVPSPPPVASPPEQQASLASSALCLDCLHANPSTSSVDQSAEACLISSKDAAKTHMKSGNFNW